MTNRQDNFLCNCTLGTKILYKAIFKLRKTSTKLLVFFCYYCVISWYLLTVFLAVPFKCSTSWDRLSVVRTKSLFSASSSSFSRVNWLWKRLQKGNKECEQLSGTVYSHLLILWIKQHWAKPQRVIPANTGIRGLEWADKSQWSYSKLHFNLIFLERQLW